jgi:hypothetical protein
LCLSSRTSKVKDWSALPDGIVSLIGEALLADDALSYIAFRRVCSYWRNATEDPTITDRRFCPRKWMLMWGSDKYDPKRFVCKMEFNSTPKRQFQNSTTGKCVQVHIPELCNNILNACLEGLLLITGWCRGRVTSRLLNPFTGSTIEYPDICNLLINYASTETKPPLISFADSSSFTIVVIAQRFMAYAEPGQATWKFVWLGPHCFLSPVFFHGRIYSFSTKGGLLQLEIEKNQNSSIEYKIETLIVGPPKGISIRDVKCYFLVECGGQLLAVFLSNWTRSRQYFRIFMVANHEIRESDGDDDKIFLLPVKNLNNYAIFIHPWFPGISIPTNRFPCLLPNSIYFYEGGSSVPKVYRQRKYLPSYWPVKGFHSVSAQFSLFPVPASTCSGHGACTATDKRRSM